MPKSLQYFLGFLALLYFIKPKAGTPPPAKTTPRPVSDLSPYVGVGPTPKPVVPKTPITVQIPGIFSPPSGQPLILQQGPTGGQGFQPTIQGSTISSNPVVTQTPPASSSPSWLGPVSQMLAPTGQAIGQGLGSLVTSGINAFTDWINSPSAPATPQYNSGPTYYDQSGSFQLPQYDYSDIQFQ